MASRTRPMAERLRLTRLALKLNGKQMAELCGITEGNWSEIESGKREISKNALIRLCTRTSISTDWVLLGKIDTIPERIAAEIRRVA